MISEINNARYIIMNPSSDVFSPRYNMTIVTKNIKEIIENTIPNISAEVTIFLPYLIIV